LKFLIYRRIKRKKSHRQREDDRRRNVEKSYVATLKENAINLISRCVDGKKNIKIFKKTEKKEKYKDL